LRAAQHAVELLRGLQTCSC